MTKIEWVRNADGSAGESWNPVVGCSIATPGCTNCYAQRTAWRLANNPATPHYAGTVELVKGKPVWTGKVARAPEAVLTKPLRRRKPTTYFVNSMGDLFHEDVPDEWILDVLTVAAVASHHTLQVLTKRGERMRDFMSRPDLLEDIYANWSWFSGGPREVAAWPLPNVWVGVSAERQKEWDERKEHLRQTPAAVRFASFEPLLGPIDGIPDWLDWVIVGGESGPGARPMHPDWPRAIRDQAVAAGVPFFFKQWGKWLPGQYQPGHGPLRWQDGTAGGEIRDVLRWGDGVFSKLTGKTRAGRALDGETWDQMPASVGADR